MLQSVVKDRGILWGKIKYGETQLSSWFIGYEFGLIYCLDKAAEAEILLKY